MNCPKNEIIMYVSVRDIYGIKQKKRRHRFRPDVRSVSRDASVARLLGLKDGGFKLSQCNK